MKSLLTQASRCFLQRLILVFAVFGTGSLWAEPVAVGRADMVVGDVQILTPSKTGQKLSVGQVIHEGTTLSTGSDGYVYINTVDQGFISLRPNSRLSVELYRYDKQQPQESQIRLVLHRGVMRAISGRGAQAAKDKYRLNTPVVAIGIRGTDYTVFTNQDVTRTTVTRGGVVMTPLGGACHPSGLGPCEGENSLDLLAGRLILQSNRGETRPRVVDHPELRPDYLIPPRSDETLKSTSATTGQVETNKQAEIAKVAANTLTNPVETKLASALMQDAIVEIPQTIYWGRWQALADQPAQSLSSLKTNQREWVALMGPFVMVRDLSAQPILPITGSYDFRLKDYEAYFFKNQSNWAGLAQIQNAWLNINFGSLTFQTGFDVTGSNQTSPISLSSQGVIGTDGAFLSTITQTGNMTVKGAVSGTTAQEAGYLFNATLDKSTRISGATRWTR